jgi:hypothetical protein
MHKCPKRPVSFLQSGHSAKPRFNEVAFYEAAAGDLDLPAIKRQSMSDQTERKKTGEGV